MVDGPFPFVAAIAAVETIQGRHVWRPVELLPRPVGRLFLGR
jgi:hypothetical protein